MKKILIICPNFFPVPAINGGAVETLIQNLIDENEKSHNFNFEVLTIFDKRNNYSKYKYTKFIFVNNNLFLFYLTKKRFFKRQWLLKIYILKIKKYIHEEDYDNIIVENEPEIGKSLKNNSKVILHLHNDYINKEKCNSKQMLSYYNIIITISEYLKKRVLEVEPQKKCFVIYNGIDLKNYVEMNKNELQKIMREKNNIDIKKFVLIFTGRYSKEKGLYELLSAFSKIDDENIVLILCGKPLSYNDKYYKKIQPFFSNSRIINFGYIKNEELYKYYAMANLLIVPSLWEEPFGLVVIEGMASYLPVIATNKGGIPEIIYNKSFLINTNNIQTDLINGILMMKNNCNLQELSIASHQRALEFSKAKFFERFTTLLMEVNNEKKF